MSEAKTQPTGVPVDTFLAAVEPAVRRTDAMALRDLLAGITGEPAVMWGPSIVGFGRYRLVYESGREGDWPVIGFSPRKANLVLYLAPGFAEKAELMQRLGQPKTGVSCLYLKRARRHRPGRPARTMRMVDRAGARARFALLTRRPRRGCTHHARSRRPRLLTPAVRRSGRCTR